MQGPNLNVELVDSLDKCTEFLGWISVHCGTAMRDVPLAIDTETTGLDWWSYAFTRLVQFGTPAEGWAVPVEWFGRVIHEAMRIIVESRREVIFHNAKFDLHALEGHGYPVPHFAQVHDTAILYRLYRSDQSAALKGKLTATLLGPWIYQGKAWLKDVSKQLGLTGTDKWKFIPVDEPAYWAYGTMDTCITALAFATPEIQGMLADPAYLRERHYAAIMYRCEKRGMLVDEEYTTALSAQFQRTIDTELAYLQSQGIRNPNSNDQVAELFEADFSWIPNQFTATGKAQLNKAVLESLATAGGLQAEVVQSLINFKRATKWKASYTDTFLHKRDRFGYVHPSINTMGARTGRVTINTPALQTLPSKDALIRTCILPPPGHLWYAFDYSNQEPRTLAHYSQSPRLLEFFREGADRSVHDFVADQLFGAGYTKPQRDIAKIFGLSRSYGAEAPSMAAALGLTVREVEAILPGYDDLMGLAGLKAAIARANEDRDPMYIITKGGRRVYLADVSKAYSLVNALMQGSGADMHKDSVIRLDREGFADFIQVPVHDETTMALPKGEDHEAMAEEIRKLLEDDTYSVPMPVGVEGPGASWGALYEGK